MIDKPQTLRTRMIQMYLRWSYSPEDRAEMDRQAKENYQSMRAFVARDERIFGNCSLHEDFNKAWAEHIAHVRP